MRGLSPPRMTLEPIQEITMTTGEAFQALATAFAGECDTERAINGLFRACRTGAGVEWETPQSFRLIERLWDSDTVISAVDDLHEAHERGADDAGFRQKLVAKTDAAIREPDE